MTIKQYVERRDKVIADFINGVSIEYRKSQHLRQMMDRAIELTVALQVAPCDKISQEVVNDLLGFMVYVEDKPKITRSSALTTIYHDLAEFKANRDEKWFCPRSAGYSKYLSGASNIIS